MEIASGEDSGFSPTWVDITTAPFEVNRYLRLQVTLNSLSATTPAELSLVSLNFSGHLQGDFEFVGACGRVNGGGAHAVFAVWMLLLWLLPVAVFLKLRWSTPYREKCG